MRCGAYRTWIPSDAVEVVEERHPSGTKKSASYFLGREKVGFRLWDEVGQLEFENSFRRGVRHGNEYRFHPNGQVLEVTPYRDGCIHGTGRQWAEDGRLLVTYRLVHNTGLDLWCWNGGALSEEHYLPKHGELGYRREWNCDDRTIWQEYFYVLGKGYHGVWREWNSGGRLRRGFPRYFVADRRVTKRQYLRACLADPRLPRYRAVDNEPARDLPAEYLAQRTRRR
jgi:antitoxin component YwqK of YwqJK toxin-antitoxin module